MDDHHILHNLITVRKGVINQQRVGLTSLECIINHMIGCPRSQPMYGTDRHTLRIQSDSGCYGLLTDNGLCDPIDRNGADRNDPHCGHGGVGGYGDLVSRGLFLAVHAPALELLTGRCGKTTFRQDVLTVNAGHSCHSAAAAGGVKGHSAGGYPNCGQGGVGGHSDPVTHVLFLAVHTPAQELHAGRRGKTTFRQNVLTRNTGHSRHGAAAAGGVKAYGIGGRVAYRKPEIKICPFVAIDVIVGGTGSGRTVRRKGFSVKQERGIFSKYITFFGFQIDIQIIVAFAEDGVLFQIDPLCLFPRDILVPFIVINGTTRDGKIEIRRRAQSRRCNTELNGVDGGRRKCCGEQQHQKQKKQKGCDRFRWFHSFILSFKFDERAGDGLPSPSEGMLKCKACMGIWIFKSVLRQYKEAHNSPHSAGMPCRCRRSGG